MAKKITLKIWSALVSAFAFLNSQMPSHANSTPIERPTPQIVYSLNVKRSKKPLLFLQKAVSSNSGDWTFAGHRSHSSHRSHYSHRSGTTSAPPSTTSPTRESVTPESVPRSTSPATPTPARESTTPQYVPQGATPAAGTPYQSIPSYSIDVSGVIVIDGDTLYYGQKTYRIVGVDTPEKGQPNFDAAKKRLEQLIQTGTVTFQELAKDEHDRTLVKVYVDGQDVAETLKREGFNKP